MMEKKAYIFGAIFFLSNRIQNEGDKVFSEITTKQWFLLISIIRSGVNGPTLTEVSKIIGYSRQNVKKLSVNLEKAGLVELQKDVNDSRVLRISLTDNCYQYFKNRQEKEEEFIEKLYDGITEEELDSMLLVMKKLEKNIVSLD